jgi:hypothetical protein
VLEMLLPCDHSAWLQITDPKGQALLDGGRLARISQELENADNQRPTVIFFIGRRSKEVALEQLFPRNNNRKSRKVDRNSLCEGIARIHLDNTTARSEYPLYFAESDPSFRWPFAPPRSACHESRVVSRQWKPPFITQDSLYNILHSRLFWPFTDVICLFADDFSTPDEMVNRLEIWASSGNPLAKPLDFLRPRVIIIKDSSQFKDLSISCDVLSKLHTCFSEIKLFEVAPDTLSPKARYRSLKEYIQKTADEARHCRQIRGLLFSANHLAALFGRAVEHVAKAFDKPFDLLAASRCGSGLHAHDAQITRFLDLGRRVGASSSSLMSHIGSTILLDAYPPGMHCESSRP